MTKVNRTPERIGSQFYTNLILKAESDFFAVKAAFDSPHPLRQISVPRSSSFYLTEQVDFPSEDREYVAWLQ
jgi:hypothetical protein